DGHINLSRTLASRGHFPAIEVPTSASRVTYDIISRAHWDAALKLKSLIATYNENIDLIQIGAYQAGTNALLDEAVAKMPAIETFLRQGIDDRSNFEDAMAGLARLI